MNSKLWLKIFFICIFTCGILPYFFSFIFLKANFENNSYKDIVKRQLEKGSIYGTVLNQNTFSYKLELVKQVKPDIIALGSSRVMQFRKEGFNTSFINAGGSMNYLNEGLTFLEKMYTFHSPKYIILGLDFWWFNDTFSQPQSFPYHNNTGNVMSVSKLLKPYYWLLNKKLDMDTVSNIFSNSRILNNYTNYDNLGFLAIKTSDGFRSDGSYLYSKTLFGLSRSNDEYFSDTYSRIENGDRRFQYASRVSEERILLLKKIIEYIHNNNTKLIIVIPPLANAINEKMKKYNYSYILDLINNLVKYYPKIYNYNNSSSLTLNDCEFIDGFHGGDIVYFRMLKDLYLNKSVISNYINIDYISNNINKFNGNTLSINQNEKFNFKEIDFLKLQCKKLKGLK